MDDEKLILLVQEQEFIYNKYLAEYRNVEKKKIAWNKIAQQMGLPVDICMKRWTCLRDRYTKEKRKENLPSGSGSVYKYNWPLLDCMSFLAPHIVPRPTRYPKNIFDEMHFSQFSQSAQSLQSSQSPQSPQSPQSIKSPKSSRSPQSIQSPQSPQSPQLQKSQFISFANFDVSDPINSNTETSPLFELDGRKRKRKISEQKFEEIFLDTMQSLRNVCTAQEEKMKKIETDPLHGFGIMVVGTISSMSARKQAKAIDQITHLLMKIKLEPEG